MKILVVGAGMYVTGRHGSGTGTILSSLAEFSKQHSVQKVTIIANRPENESEIKTQTSRINTKLETDLNVEYVALGKESKAAYESFVETHSFDCAIVSTPDHWHHFHTKKLLTQKIPCLVVKPLCPTVEEVADLIREQSKNSVYGAVEFHKRFDETNLYTKKVLQSGELGKILYFTVDYSQRIHIPMETFKAWSNKTNIFQYLAVHYVDLIYFLTGATPIRSSAYGTKGILIKNGIDTFDSVNASIIWKADSYGDEFISQFSVNWIDPNSTSAMSDQRFKVIGTKGRLEVDQKHRGLEKVTEKGTEHPNPYFSEYLKDTNEKWKFCGYGYNSIERFLLDVKDLTEKRVSLQFLEQNRPTFKSSLISTAVIESINKSLYEQSNWMPVHAKTL